MSRLQKMTYSNVATSRIVCTSKGITQICRDIPVVSQHQLNVATHERQCRDIKIKIQDCISMSQHHHNKDLSLETENCLTDCQCHDTSYNPQH